jgi:hypothetical protein
VAITLTETGSVGVLNDLIAEADYWVHLFLAPETLPETTTLSDFVEATFPGYRPLPISLWFGSRWVVDRAEAIADTVAWVVTAGLTPQDVFGAYITLGSSGPLRYAELRPYGPLNVRTLGQVVEYTPRLTLRTDPMQT